MAFLAGPNITGSILECSTYHYNSLTAVADNPLGTCKKGYIGLVLVSVLKPLR